MIKTSSSNHDQLKDDKVDFKGAKRKKTKIFGPNFLTFLLKINFEPTLRQCHIRKISIERRWSIVNLNPL
jgi:hypothetical protein